MPAHVTWENYADNELFFIGSSDEGQTWSDPVNIVDEDARPAVQTWPGMSVAPDGRIDLAWHDFRNDSFAAVGDAADEDDAVEARYWDVYYTYSADGGKTWAPNVRVTDRSIDGDEGVTFGGGFTGPIGVASTDYAALVTWPDSRAGEPLAQAEDAYFTRIRFSAPPLPGDDAGGSNLLWGLLGGALTLAVAGLILVLFTVRGSRHATSAEPGSASAAAPPARR